MANLVKNGYFTSPNAGTSYTQIISSTNWSWSMVDTANNSLFLGGTGTAIVPTSTRPLNSGITQLMLFDNSTSNSFANSGISQTITFPNVGNWVLSFWVCKRNGFSSASVHTYRFQLGSFLDKTIVNTGDSWLNFSIPFKNTELNPILTISTSIPSGNSLNSLILSGVSIVSTDYTLDLYLEWIPDDTRAGGESPALGEVEKNYKINRMIY